jgi:effector-binding domain-containing protein
MLTTPVIQQRAEQPYVSIHAKVNMDKIPAVLPPLIPEVSAWLGKNNMNPDGPPFFLYRSMDKNNDMVAEVGFPVKERTTGDGHIRGGIFPAGKYAVITYTGDYKNIREAHRALELWIRENGWKQKQEAGDNGTEWGILAESYVTDPQKEPDPQKWRTEVLFLLERGD